MVEKYEPFSFRMKQIDGQWYIYIQRYVYRTTGRKTESYSLGPITKMEEIITKYMNTGSSLFFGETLIYFFGKQSKLHDEISEKLTEQHISTMEQEQFHWLIALRCIRPFSKHKLFRYLPHSYMSIVHPVPTENFFYEIMDQMGDLPKLFHHYAENLIAYLHHTYSLTSFDTTTIFFYSDYDDLRRKGFGKDGKRGSPLIKLALACTEDYIPLNYQIYPGNASDITTFKDFIESADGTVLVGKKILLFDAGCYSFDIVNMLEDKEISFICCADISSYSLYSDIPESSEEIKNEKRTKFSLIGFATEPWEQTIEIRDQKWILKLGEYKGKRIIEAFNEEHHLSAVEKLNKKIDLAMEFSKTVIGRDIESKTDKIKSLINGIGLKSLLTINVSEETISLISNEKNIQKRKNQLRKIVLITNIDFKTNAREILENYLKRTDVESVFSYLKTPLDIRPVYHWKHRRIHAHCFIVLLGYLLLTGLRLYLKSTYQYNFTLEELLENLQFSTVHNFEPKPTKFMTYLGQQQDWIKQLVKDWNIPIKTEIKPQFSFTKDH